MNNQIYTPKQEMPELKPNKTVRSSNIELYRIIVMFFILSHHFVVFTPLISQTLENPNTWQAHFLAVFGAFGKMGIDCFVLITGYFMCTSHISFKKFIKLLFQVEFWIVATSLFLAALGYDVTWSDFIIKVSVAQLESGFTTAFLFFYLTIPLINLIIKKCNESKHLMLMGGAIMVCSVLSSIPHIPIVGRLSAYILWFPVLYLVSSYIRLYNQTFWNNRAFWKLMAATSFIVSILSVWFTLETENFPFVWIADSNKPLALLTSISLFCCFKNMNIPYSKTINRIASATFGILLIHSSSQMMRDWLFNDFGHFGELFNSPLIVPLSILYVLLIYGVCVLLELLRIKYVEPLYIR